jgi:hypothetical protein
MSEKNKEAQMYKVLRKYDSMTRQNYATIYDSQQKKIKAQAVEVASGKGIVFSVYINNRWARQSYENITLEDWISRFEIEPSM